MSLKLALVFNLDLRHHLLGSCFLTEDLQSDIPALPISPGDPRLVLYRSNATTTKNNKRQGRSKNLPDFCTEEVRMSCRFDMKV